MAALQPVNLGEGRTATAVTAGGYHMGPGFADATRAIAGNGPARISR